LKPGFVKQFVQQLFAAWLMVQCRISVKTQFGVDDVKFTTVGTVIAD